MLPGLMQQTPLTITSIFERMRTIYADGVIVAPEGRFTFAESAERILRIARALTEELGVKPGDRVASFAFNSGRHFELYYAVPLVGAVLHTINVRLYDEQIAYITNHAEDQVVFFDAELEAQLAETAPQLQTVRAYVRMGDQTCPTAVPGARDYDDLLATYDPLTSLPAVDENAAMGICYTSGTTGMPKGVVSSHRGTWLHAMAACMHDHLALGERDRVFPVVPLFHAFGWGMPYAAIFTGAELVFHGSDNSPANLARVFRDEKPTVSAGVPTIWKSLLPLTDTGEADLSSLRLIFVGGSASPRALIEAYTKLGVEYLQAWGMTETGPLACVSRPRRRHRDIDADTELDLREKTGTIFSGIEARIVDDQGKPLDWDGVSPGELEVRGPWIASDYYNDPSSSEKFHDGWLRTGDMAVMEHDGYFRIVDRAKDLVKSGGEWISSVELEGHLLAHPEVADAAVVGIKSKKWDERPVAVVVPANGAAPTLDSLRSFLADRVAKWWLPDEVVLVDEIPKTSVGKLDKKVMRDQLAHMELP